MCIFSQHVELVAATKIFARGLPDGRQALIYAMDVAAKQPLAMVLPLPVPPGGPDDAVELVSLEGYPTLFEDLKRAFPETTLFAVPAMGRAMSNEVPKLVVHQVGAFEASYVPSPRDFDRLDPRFRLSADVLRALPQYADWGFAVVQLAAGTRKAIHPLALRFPRRDPGALFFPTVHVHDGALPETAAFDHQFYAQLDPVVAQIAAWTSSHKPLGYFVGDGKTTGLIDAASLGQTMVLMGSAPNRDLVLRAAPVTLDDLQGDGETYEYSVNASYHYSLVGHNAYPKWRDTMATKLPRICAGLRSGLAELTTRNARAWELGPLTPELPPHFMNGHQLWHGTDYTNGGRATTRGRGRIAFQPFGQLVEQQHIELGFSKLPTERDAQTINRALCQLLDQIAS